VRYFDAKALWVASASAVALVVAIYAGSRGFKYFDTALTSYAFASVFAMFAVVYRYAVWAQRPPTRMYLKRGWELFLEKGPSLLKRKQKHKHKQKQKQKAEPVKVARNGFALGRMLLDNFFLQKFIGKRSYERWIMHACLSWGGMLAFALTFPLVFGWMHFQTLPDDAETYRVLVFGFAIDQFHVYSLKGIIAFNMLNFSAIVMLVGLALCVKRRMSDSGDMAVQTFGDDIFPIFLLFTVATTGLMLTVSAKLMAGRGFGFIAIAHAASVIALLLYLPFGKLFHIFQRSASLGVSFYKKVGADGARAHCKRCGGDFASQMHVDDLKVVLDQLGFDYRYDDASGEVHYQDICPCCRRKVLALSQGRSIGR
jgi:nitrate reductase gamma subunit